MIAVVLILSAVAAAPQIKEFQPLWNGKDLSQFETYLGRDGGGDPIGVNKDPYGVFSVVTVDGAPAIRISGQVWGALTTNDELEDYHLRVEVKWGEKKWPPRQTQKRDSGILYHCVGPHGAGSAAWMRSLESQVQEGDFGDFHSVNGVIVDVTASDPSPPVPKALQFDAKAPVKVGVTSRILKAGTWDRKDGGWNVMEVVAVGATTVHIVNGKVVMVLRNPRHVVDGHEVPLRRGRIQLQSESAEVFYRKLEVKPLKQVPTALLR